MLLSDLIYQSLNQKVEDSVNLQIRDVCNDSREAATNSLFVAASGYVEDVHPYIASAFEKGCRAFVIHTSYHSLQESFSGAVFVEVNDTHKALVNICKIFFGDLSTALKIIGITGTNGKTTTSTVIFRTLRYLGIPAGLIGTIEYRINDRVYPASNTTPDLLVLYKLLAQMKQEGVDIVVMEVSSHALELGRVEGLEFDITCFTNLTQDHLDFHKDMESYLKAKLKLFSLQTSSKKVHLCALINKDIQEYSIIEEHIKHFPQIKMMNYSIQDPESDYYARIEDLSPVNTRFSVNHQIFNISMIGLPNVYNFTLAHAVLCELGIDIKSYLEFLKEIKVRGRMESLHSPKGFSVIIDYAHSPDALQNLLTTCKSVIKGQGRIICVFGAGGDRDKSKRPVMGNIAQSISDIVIVTSDNPRTEDPGFIIEDITAGMTDNSKPYQIEIDRESAIIKALKLAENQDIVVIAGKGHEDYQIIGKTKHHFSDKEIVERELQLK